MKHRWWLINLKPMSLMTDGRRVIWTTDCSSGPGSTSGSDVKSVIPPMGKPTRWKFAACRSLRESLAIRRWTTTIRVGFICTIASLTHSPYSPKDHLRRCHVFRILKMDLGNGMSESSSLFYSNTEHAVAAFLQWAPLTSMAIVDIDQFWIGDVL